ncbi:GerAB/ArcD/ProY family transporter [Paenibacillus sp. y28]|uniref:GerAB/ArcD/ProY family transporter n=1 Tax=Paenibacillus sp. y28 TaxID=3129110 RepID=UPI00301A503B
MKHDTFITPRQFTIMVILFTIGSTILILPAPLASEAKQDAWLVALAGAILGLLIGRLYTAVALLHPGLSFIQQTEFILGKPIGTLFNLSFIFMCYTSSAELVYYVSSFVLIEWMPDTPIQFIHLLFTGVVILGVYLGLPTIARAAEILFPWFVLLFSILAITVVPLIDLKNIQPVFEASPARFAGSVLHYSSILSFPGIVMLMVYPIALKQPQQARSAMGKGIFLGGLVLEIISLLTILALGPTITAMKVYPSYTLARIINIGDFLQRIEAIMALIWIISLYFRTVMYFYASVKGVLELLKLSSFRPLALPSWLLLVDFSLIVHPSTIHAASYDYSWIPFILMYSIGLPLLLLGVHTIRKKMKSRTPTP